VCAAPDGPVEISDTKSPVRPVLTEGRAPQDGHAPLTIAAYNGHLAVMELLVAKGADLNAANKVRDGRVGDFGRANGV